MQMDSCTCGQCGGALVHVAVSDNLHLRGRLFVAEVFDTEVALEGARCHDVVLHGDLTCDPGHGRVWK